MIRRLFICTECQQSVIVKVRKEDLMPGGRLERPPECPMCHKGQMIHTSKPGPLDPKDTEITTDEFMFFLAGLALPGEVVTQKEPVVAMLLAHRVVKVDATSVNDRCVVESILLDNGVRLYFAASGMGAVVWRAVREEKEDAGSGDRPRDDDEQVREHGQEENHPSGGAG